VSIYGSIFAIEDERQWIAELKAAGVDAGVIRDGEPTPDELDAPLVYQGSHILPDEGDPRGGSLDLALIPAHITRDGRDNRDESEGPWPYLRLGVHAHDSTYNGGGDATIVLTVRQAARLRDALAEWIEDTSVAAASSAGGAGGPDAAERTP
jgi:hypothetical protein